MPYGYLKNIYTYLLIGRKIMYMFLTVIYNHKNNNNYNVSLFLKPLIKNREFRCCRPAHTITIIYILILIWNQKIVASVESFILNGLWFKIFVLPHNIHINYYYIDIMMFIGLSNRAHTRTHILMPHIKRNSYSRPCATGYFISFHSILFYSEAEWPLELNIHCMHKHVIRNRIVFQCLFYTYIHIYAYVSEHCWKKNPMPIIITFVHHAKCMAACALVITFEWISVYIFMCKRNIINIELINAQSYIRVDYILYGTHFIRIDSCRAAVHRHFFS